jgi:N-acetylmuramoyl-L-alanine amidase
VIPFLRIVTYTCVLAAFHSVQAASPCRPTFKIAIDIGHTKEATGAISARGVTEYSFNTQLVDFISSRLKAAGVDNVLAIGARGIGREQLRERSAKINSVLPDLLLSIHHDDTQAIFHKKWMVSGIEREYSDVASGFSIFVSSKNVKFQQSMKFATLLGTALRHEGLTYSHHHAADIDGERKKLIDANAGVYLYDDLYVLRNASVPAILLEAGVITDRDEEKRLASDSEKIKLADSVLHAIADYCGSE